MLWALRLWGWGQPGGPEPGAQPVASHQPKAQVCKSKKFMVN